MQNTRLIQFRPAWDIILYSRLKNIPLVIDNTNIDITLDRASPVVIHANKIFSENDCLFGLETQVNSTDKIFAEYLKTSVIDVYTQILQQSNQSNYYGESHVYRLFRNILDNLTAVFR